MRDPALPESYPVPEFHRAEVRRDRPWLIVVEERARHWSRQCTGSDAFWRFYIADIAPDMVRQPQPSGTFGT